MTKSGRLTDQIWIGLIKVEQKNRNGPFGDADRAYTNVLGLASTKTQFRNLVVRTLKELDLTLLRLEGAELLKQRKARCTVHDEILNLAPGLDRENPIAFDVFATFEK